MLSLLEMSITGGVLTLAVVLIRAMVIHRLPKKAFLVLWTVVLCRLLIPFSIPSPVSLYSAAAQLGVTTRRPGILMTGQASPLLDTGIQSLHPALLVWLAVASLLALFFLLAHLRARRRYRASLPVEQPFVLAWLEQHRLRRPVQARYSDQISAPLTYGVLWPVILLPKQMDWSDETRLSFILAHEMAHIRRFDALTKWVLAAAVCIHWFNPLVWVMYVLFNRDLELSCDETVVHQYGTQARGPYALTLVELEEHRSCFSPLSSGFSKTAMEERITAIMKSKKTTIAGIAAALLLVVVLTAVFATSAPSKPSLASPTPASTSMPEKDQSQVLSKGRNESGWQPDQETGHYYTKAQYQLVSDFLTKEYQADRSIAEFNRTLHAAFNSYGNKDYEASMAYAYEMLRSEIPSDDPIAPYVINTMQASLNEYDCRLDEVYSGKQHDPDFYGQARRVQTADIFGDQVEIEVIEVNYTFTYRILEQDKLTVGARDQFLQDFMNGVQAYLETLDSSLFEDEDEAKDVLIKEMDRLGQTLSNTSMKYTGAEIDYLNFYSSY